MSTQRTHYVTTTDGVTRTNSSDDNGWIGGVTYGSVIVAVTVLTVLAAVGASLVQTPVYEAEAEVVVDHHVDQPGEVDGRRPAQDPAGLVDRRDRLTGELDGPLCYGAEKVTKVREYVARLAHTDPEACDLSEATLYTDSVTDLPLLRAVGYPIVVNPDLRLRWLARRYAWPVQQW